MIFDQALFLVQTQRPGGPDFELFFELMQDVNGFGEFVRLVVPVVNSVCGRIGLPQTNANRVFGPRSSWNIKKHEESAATIGAQK